jgi:hypothetical protein
MKHRNPITGRVTEPQEAEGSLQLGKSLRSEPGECPK